MTNKRYSKQREAIMQTLRATKEHPDAEAVYASVRKLIPNISLGTVYRNLNQMAAVGEVLAIEAGDGKVHFDADVSSHQHFVCTQCQKITDVYYETDFAAKLKQDGYLPLHEHIVFSGWCADCAKNKKHES